jgi:hypothetical protein
MQPSQRPQESALALQGLSQFATPPPTHPVRALQEHWCHAFPISLSDCFAVADV